MKNEIGSLFLFFFFLVGGNVNIKSNRNSVIFNSIFIYSSNILLHSFFFTLFFHDRFDSFTDSEFQYTPASMISRKTLFYLIATLNASFNPDYDFSNCRAEEFSREPSVKVLLLIIHFYYIHFNNSKNI